jgi:RimJ/RimL family protein N-acetyltransferase
MNTILETARLRLRELDDTDLEFMVTMLVASDVMRHYPRRQARELAGEWIARQRSRYEQDGHGLWLAELRDSGERVGQIGLMRQAVNGIDECEVGYLIDRPFWRRGLATEGALATRDYAFGVMNRPRVVSLVMPDNLPGQGVARRLGMEVIGRAPHNGHEHLVYAVANPRGVSGDIRAGAVGAGRPAPTR